MNKLFKKLRSKKGEMLVETIVGAALLTVLMAALVTMLLSATSFSMDAFNLNKHNNDNTKALNVGDTVGNSFVAKTTNNFKFEFSIDKEDGTTETYSVEVPGKEVTAAIDADLDEDKLFMFVPDD